MGWLDMNQENVVEKLLDHESRISKHTEDIKNLFEQQKDIRKLADATQEMAKNMAALTEQMKSMDGRMMAFEEDKGKKGFAIWQIVMSALVGGVVTYIVTNLLR